MKTRLFAMLLAGLMFSGLGCGRRADARGYPIADTPQQAMENMRQAGLSGDKEAYLACFQVTPNVERIMNSAFDFDMAMRGFRRKLAVMYGREAAEQFDGEPCITDGLEDFPAMDDMTFDVDGDRAITTTEADDDSATGAPGEDSKPAELVRVDGVWYVVVPEEGNAPTGQEFDMIVAIMEARPGAVDDVAQRIGDDGVTIEQLSRELAAELDRAAMDASLRVMGPEGLEEAMMRAMVRASREARAERASQEAQTPLGQ